MIYATRQKNGNTFFYPLYVFPLIQFPSFSHECFLFLTYPIGLFLSTRYKFHLSLWNYNSFLFLFFFDHKYSFHQKQELFVLSGAPFHLTQCYGSLTKFYITRIFEQAFISVFSMFPWKIFAKLAASFYSVEIFENFALFFSQKQVSHLRKSKCYPTLVF